MDDQKLKTIQSIADLLKHTTIKELSFQTGTDVDEPIPTTIVYRNVVFSEEEHELVKKKFLHLLSTL